MSGYKIFHRAVFSSILFSALPAITQAETGGAGELTFEKKVKPFLEKYCMDCHDNDSRKGKVSLEDLHAVTAENASMWRRVWEQVALKEMPPRKKSNQPELMERLELSNWITGGMVRALENQGGFVDHLRPAKGNHLDHDLLFGPLPKDLEPASTPARIWRIQPQEHLVRLNDLVLLKRKYDPERPGLWTHGDHIPSNLEGQTKVYFGLDGYLGSPEDTYNFATLGFNAKLTMIKDHGLRNYPFLYTVNSAEASQIASDAETILRFMAYGPPGEPWQFAESYSKVPDQYKHPGLMFYSNEIKRPLTPVYDLMKNPGVSDEGLTKAINFLFEALTLRPPTAEETATYLEIANKSIKQLGKEDGTFLGLTPIFLDRDALFRPELCENWKQPDKYGRAPLQGQELALAINAAFSYIRPDNDHLWTALAEGKLKTREDVKREVTRILNDDSIRKPRILQFFREYFDYDRCGTICKDTKVLEQEGVHVPSYYPQMYSMIANTDCLVEMIVREDKNVLQELLTTDRVIYMPYWADPRWEQAMALSDQYFFTDRGKPFVHVFEPSAEKKPSRPGEFNQWEATQKDQLHHVFPKPPQPIYVRQSQYNHSFSPPAKDALKSLTTVDTKDRLGILTHPVWLISHSDAVTNHAISRGRWIRERLLGGSVPDVPITVDAKLPEEPQSTLRHRMRVTRVEECWRCHQKMDPLGLPFEMYNQVGFIRDRNGNGDQGQKVDATGEIILSGDPALDGPVANPIEMIRKLAASERVKQVFVRHVFRYWMGRNETINDAPILQDAYRAYKDSGGSMKALLTSLLTSDAFLYRKVSNGLNLTNS